MRDIDHIVQLLQAYISGSLHPYSDDELGSLFDRYPGLRELAQEVRDEQGLRAALAEYETLYSEAHLEGEERVLQRILTEIREDEHAVRTPRRMWIYGLVASVALLVVVGLAVFQNHSQIGASDTPALGANLLPGTNKAQLSFSDGRQVDLSSAYGGIVVGDRIAYDDGTAVLEEELPSGNTLLTLATPKGGQYQIVLPDGTKVWLNADSRLEYPVMFSGDTRNVQLEGEAYFEVAENKEKPFIVHTAGERVQVLGTHFNINAYRDEQISTVALLEGKVKVTLPNNTARVLRPGEQSSVSNGTIEVQPVNVDEAVAWKNGEFMFNNENLSSVMRKLARWYNLEIELEPGLETISIWGSVSRYDDFSKVLQIIKATDDRIRFAVKGRRVTLMK
ncbi:FecR family protein [Parapedobacter sp. DT-150]|uniref:FecR family protein n=1 Tax=Parapedobacter sp. DT-150 TaxID=3396162 RepID=UPI003F1B563A